METLASWDGGTAHNPQPDWWQARKIVLHEGSGTVYHEQPQTNGTTIREALTCAADVLAVTWLDDEDLEIVLDAVS